MEGVNKALHIPDVFVDICPPDCLPLLDGHGGFAGKGNEVRSDPGQKKA